MPNEIGYDEAKRRLLVGKGSVENVPPEVWNYEVSGKRVLTQWFSYRKKQRERPIMGDRRRPSKLGDIQPDHWLAEYTTELLSVLHVLALLVEKEPDQSQRLEAICAEPTLDFRRSARTAEGENHPGPFCLGSGDSGVVCPWRTMFFRPGLRLLSHAVGREAPGVGISPAHEFQE